jgi:hypothetical protein
MVRENKNRPNYIFSNVTQQLFFSAEKNGTIVG